MKNKNESCESKAVCVKGRAEPVGWLGVKLASWLVARLVGRFVGWSFRDIKEPAGEHIIISIFPSGHEGSQLN